MRKKRQHKPKDRKHGSRTPAVTVTVCTAPTIQGNHVSLDNELRLTRSALLYADHVKLVSPAVSWVRTLKPLQSVDPENLLLSIANLPSLTLRRLGVPEQYFKVFRQQMKHFAALPKKHPQRLEAEKQWYPAYHGIRTELEKGYLRPKAPDLDLAIESQALTLVSDGMELDDDRETQISGFRNHVLESLQDQSGTVLLDQLTDDFIHNAVLRKSPTGPVTQDRSRRAAVGTGLIERLPTFPDAPMETVLEVREELSEARKSYRVAMRTLTEKLASNAFDAGIAGEIDELWHDEVQPTLVEMRKQVSVSRLAYKSGMRLVTDGYSVPTLAVGVASLASFADLVPTVVAATGASARIAVAGIAEACAAYSAQQANGLVYLINLNKRFGNHGLK